MSRFRKNARITMVATLVLLGACTSTPRPAGDQSAASAAAGATEERGFDTGRLVVIATDQNGRALDRATVDVTSTGSRHFRGSGVTNRDGSVTFNGVPQQVNIDIQHQGGRYSRNFNVTPTGVTEARLIVEIQEIEAPDQADPAGGGY